MNANSQIGEMREALFGQLKRLTDPSLNLEKEVMRTEAIVNVCDTLVASCKVEVDFMRVTGSMATSFIPQSKQISDGASNSKQLGRGKE